MYAVQAGWQNYTNRIGPLISCGRHGWEGQMVMWSFAQVLHWLLIYKYLVLFPVAVLEGPIAAIVAGYFSSLGFLNVYAAYLILVIGDLIGDYSYYAMGRWGGAPFLKRWGRYLGVGKKQVQKLECAFERHTAKTLLLGKLTQGVGAFVLIAAGIARISVAEFIWYNFLATVPKSLALLLIGVFYGQSYMLIKHYLHYTALVMVAATLLLLVTYLSMKKISSRFIDNCPDELDSP